MAVHILWFAVGGFVGVNLAIVLLSLCLSAAQNQREIRAYRRKCGWDLNAPPSEGMGVADD